MVAHAIDSFGPFTRDFQKTRKRTEDEEGFTLLHNLECCSNDVHIGVKIKTSFFKSLSVCVLQHRISNNARLMIVGQTHEHITNTTQSQFSMYFLPVFDADVKSENENSSRISSMRSTYPFISAISIISISL